MHDTDWHEITLTGFYTDFRDKISSIAVAVGGALPAGFICPSGSAVGSIQPGCQNPINVDTARSYGIELAAQLKPLDIKIGDIGFTLSYTWNKNEATSGAQKGLPLANIPEHTLNMALNYSYHDIFGIFLRGEFRAKQLRTNILGRNSTTSALETILASNPNVSRYYNPYFLVHLGGNYNITNFLRLNFGIYNLLNQNFVDFYIINSNASGQTTSTAYNNYANIYEGRRYYLSLSMDF